MPRNFKQQEERIEAAQAALRTDPSHLYELLLRYLQFLVRPYWPARMVERVLWDVKRLTIDFLSGKRLLLLKQSMH